MNKKELVNQVAYEIDQLRKQTKADDAIKAPLDKKSAALVTAEKAINVIFAAITESIQKGGIVRLIGFGTFAVKQRQARTARNPRTGEAIQVPAKRVIRFSPGKALKEAVANQSKEAEASKKEKALKKG
jgi:DNA-binding protein HU-beta